VGWEVLLHSITKKPSPHTSDLSHPNWRNTQVWLKGSVLKTDRGFTARGGSNPSSSAIIL
jgi:hypothetical protein